MAEATAISFNAHNDRLQSVNPPTSSQNCCIVGWFKITDRNTYSTFWSLENNAGSSFLVLETDSDGQTVGLYDSAFGNWLFQTTALTAGTWYYFECSIIAGAVKFRYGPDSNTTLTEHTGTTNAVSFTPDKFLIASNDVSGGVEYFDGSACGVFTTNAGITNAESVVQKTQVKPVKQASLIAVWLLDTTANRLLDSSGLSHPLTNPNTGSYSDVTGPNRPWINPANGQAPLWAETRAPKRPVARPQFSETPFVYVASSPPPAVPDLSWQAYGGRVPTARPFLGTNTNTFVPPPIIPSLDWSPASSGPIRPVVSARSTNSAFVYTPVVAPAVDFFEPVSSPVPRRAPFQSRAQSVDPLQALVAVPVSLGWLPSFTSPVRAAAFRGRDGSVWPGAPIVPPLDWLPSQSAPLRARAQCFGFEPFVPVVAAPAPSVDFWAPSDSPVPRAPRWKPSSTSAFVPVVTPPAGGLYAHWKMNDAAQATIKDELGGLNLVVTTGANGNPTRRPGRLGRARVWSRENVTLHTPGNVVVGDSIAEGTVTNALIAAFCDAEWATSFWFKRRALDSADTYLTGANAAGIIWSFYGGGKASVYGNIETALASRVRFSNAAGGVFQALSVTWTGSGSILGIGGSFTAYSPPVGKWVHVAINKAHVSGRMVPSLYVNGALVQTLSASIAGLPVHGAYPSGVPRFSVGASRVHLSPGQDPAEPEYITAPLSGWLDDLRLYNRLLTAQEIAELAAESEPYTGRVVLRLVDGGQTVAQLFDTHGTRVQLLNAGATSAELLEGTGTSAELEE